MAPPPAQSALPSIHTCADSVIKLSCSSSARQLTDYQLFSDLLCWMDHLYGPWFISEEVQPAGRPVCLSSWVKWIDASLSLSHHLVKDFWVQHCFHVIVCVCVISFAVSHRKTFVFCCRRYKKSASLPRLIRTLAGNLTWMLVNVKCGLYF